MSEKRALLFRYADKRARDSFPKSDEIANSIYTYIAFLAKMEKETK